MAGKGAPKGNNYASKGRRFASTLQKRIDELKAMEGIVSALIQKALDGDMQAIKEVADRLDGKAMQGIELAAFDVNATINANVKTEHSLDASKLSDNALNELMELRRGA